MMILVVFEQFSIFLTVFEQLLLGYIWMAIVVVFELSIF